MVSGVLDIKIVGRVNFGKIVQKTFLRIKYWQILMHAILIPTQVYHQRIKYCRVQNNSRPSAIFRPKHRSTNQACNHSAICADQFFSRSYFDTL